MNLMVVRAVQMLGIVLIISVSLVLADDTEIFRWTIDSGGVAGSTGGGYELSGTIGQPEAGSLAGGDFELTGGYWFGVAPGDCDSTGCVDLLNYVEFESCIAGPASGPPIGSCRCFDVNRSSTIDLADFAEVQASFTNP